ncbi:MAG: hypothetical protein RJA25_2442 [Bacteroidota bacterium]|jgi:aspartate beta-hydroxylase
MNDNKIIEEKINLLQAWATDNSISMKDLVNIITMIKNGSRGARKPTDPLQFPDFYYPDKEAKSWHNSKDYKWVSLLESGFNEIKNEAQSIFNEQFMESHPQNNELAENGTWNTFFFYKNGIKYEENFLNCPKTGEIIESIPGTSQAGRVYFSAMSPGINVKPHCGPHNFKLRCHLGLVTDPLAIIRVGDEIRTWETGKCIIFDDSFEHEVWNRSKITRIVLIVDVWNPVLTDEEIKALVYLGVPTA